MRIKGVVSLALLMALNSFAANAIKVACVGDSITFGLDASSSSKSYPSVLSTLMGSSYSVTNYGVISTTASSNDDYPYINTSAYTNSTNAQPKLVVIMLGSNDVRPPNVFNANRYTTDLTALVTHYSTLASAPKVYLCLPPPVPGTNSPGITNANIQNLILPNVRIVAANTGTPLIDINSALTGQPQDFYSDNLHPNDAGYALIAQTVAGALKQSSPTTLTATASSGTKVDLAWSDTGTGFTAFSIERKTGTGNFAQLTTTASTARSFSDTTALASTSYSYRVRSFTTLAQSPYSNTVSVTTPGSNLPPVIQSTGATPNPGTPGQPVTFTVSASDPEGGAVTYNIDFGDGTVGINTGGTATHTYAAAGVYSVVFYAQDSLGLSVNKGLSLTIGAATNLPPVIQSLTTLPTTATVNQSVTFTATASDPEKQALNYYFDFGDGNGVFSTTSSASHAYTSSGNYRVTVYVQDVAGNTVNQSITLAITGGAVNQPPVISAIGATPNPAAVNQTVTISATATDPEHDPLSYYFSFGDGNGIFLTTGSTTHAYATAGTYKVQVFCQDTHNNTVSQSFNLTVGTPPKNTPPAFTSLSATPSPATANQAVAIKAVADDPDGDTVNYYIDFGDGNGQFSTDGTASHTYVSGGSYQVVAYAQDALNAPVSQALTLIVNGAVTAQGPAPQILPPSNLPGAATIVAGQFLKKSFSVGFAGNTGKNTLSFQLQSNALKFKNAIELLNALQNKKVLVYVGDTPIDNLTMSSDRGTGMGSISFDWRKGVVRYQVQGSALPAPVLTLNGAVNANVTGSPLNLPLFVALDGVRYGGSAKFTYKAKQDVEGMGK